MSLSRLLSSRATPTVIMANVASGVGPTSGTTITKAVDCTGANFLIVFAAGDLAAGTMTSASATFNGVSMSQDTLDIQNGPGAFLGSYSLKAPASGSHNVVVTIAGDTLVDSDIVCIPVYGVNQTTPVGTGTNSGAIVTSGTATSTVTSIIGELVFSAVGTLAASVTAGSGQTSIATVAGASLLLNVTAKAGNGSTAQTWTLTSNAWFCCGQTVKP